MSKFKSFILWVSYIIETILGFASINKILTKLIIFVFVFLLMFWALPIALFFGYLILKQYFKFRK